MIQRNRKLRPAVMSTDMTNLSAPSLGGRHVVTNGLGMYSTPAIRMNSARAASLRIQMTSASSLRGGEATSDQRASAVTGVRRFGRSGLRSGGPVGFT
jgi:hypothetical protein